MPKKQISQPALLPNLVVARVEAEQKIKTQIEKGSGIRNLIINSEEDLESARAEQSKWSKYNVELLTRLFDNASIAEEYSLGLEEIPPFGAKFAWFVNDFRKGMDEEITRLEAILERLELIPEPVVQQTSSVSSDQTPSRGIDKLETATKSTVVPFVSMSFDESDQDINQYVTGILKALRIDYETGERYSKDSIPDKVKSRIRTSDLFIIIFVKRDKIKGGGYTTPSWLLKELGIAQGVQKDVIAWVERGIKDIAGLDYEKEVIYFERENVKEIEKATIKFLEALKEHRLI